MLRPSSFAKLAVVRLGFLLVQDWDLGDKDPTLKADEQEKPQIFFGDLGRGGFSAGSSSAKRILRVEARVERRPSSFLHLGSEWDRNGVQSCGDLYFRPHGARRSKNSTARDTGSGGNGSFSDVTPVPHRVRQSTCMPGSQCTTLGFTWGPFYLSPKPAFGESPKRAPVLFAFSGTPSLHTF